MRAPTHHEVKLMALSFWRGYPPPDDLAELWWDEWACQEFAYQVRGLLITTGGEHKKREAA